MLEVPNKNKKQQLTSYLVEGKEVRERRVFSLQKTEEGNIIEKYKLVREYPQELLGRFKVCNQTFSIRNRERRGSMKSLFNIPLILLFLWFSYIVVHSFNQERVSLQINNQKCEEEFINNECENPVPQLKAFCHQKLKCMEKELDKSNLII